MNLGLYYAQDLKLAHYQKIPPRVTFVGEFPGLRITQQESNVLIGIKFFIERSTTRSYGRHRVCSSRHQEVARRGRADLVRAGSECAAHLPIRPNDLLDVGYLASLRPLLLAGEQFDCCSTNISI